MPRIQAGEVEIEFIERGQGTPLLLVHGFPLDHSMWDNQIERFASQARVIAPDLRGCGGSTVTAGTVTMEQMADDFALLLDALGVSEPVVFCGLSMGGYVAWQFWRKHRARLRALVLCDTRAAADSPETVQTRMKMREHVLRAGTPYVTEAMLPKLFAPQTFKRHPEIVESVRHKILGASPEGIAAALMGLVARPDMTDQLTNIALPTLAIVGEVDAISPPHEMRKMAEAIPGARLAVIPDAGHMPPLENPEAFNAELEEFLARVK